MKIIKRLADLHIMMVIYKQIQKLKIFDKYFKKYYNKEKKGKRNLISLCKNKEEKR